MTDSGSTNRVKVGETISSPSTADSTEMAGVIAPSPKNRQAPPMPIRPSAVRILTLTVWRWARAIRARMPPSPLLSARITRATYFTVTVRISDQKISDRMPSTSVRVTPTSVKCFRLVLSAYSGLVPMSPYTIPSTPSTAAARSGG